MEMERVETQPASKAHAARTGIELEVFIEPRPDDHWENKFIPAVHVSERVKIFDVHVDFLARLDVGDGLRKDVGPFLGQQRGDVTLGYLV